MQLLSRLTPSVGGMPVLQVGGKWLAWWVVAAAAVSQIGQFEVRVGRDGRCWP
jgi:hypothetical protein